MTSTVTNTTFSQTYRDDYTDSDNYHRILFNSGRSLQARELTQLQTIIQKEHERHARFVFKEGASVTAGSGSVDTRYEFAKLNTNTYTLPTTPSSLVGEVFTGLTSGIEVRILEVVEAEGADPATIYIQYVDNNSASGSTAPIRLTPGEIIRGNVTATDLEIQTTNITVNPAVGRGTNLSVLESTYFVSGHFVFVPKQSIILSKYSNEPTATAGFLVTEEIVTASDNTALYDNQGETPNLTAPGADRYRIRLTLTTEDQVGADETFLPAFKIVEGQISASPPPIDKSLADLGSIFAQRTFEESGNYTVKPFIVKTVDNDSDNSNLDFRINNGIAYVQGYRTELLAPMIITVPKPRTTETINNDVSAANYGNYVLSKPTAGTDYKGLLDLARSTSKINLYDATGAGGSDIGDARVASVEKDGTALKIYLFDVVMSGGNSFRDVRSIGTSSTNYVDLKLINSVATLNDAANRNYLFPLSKTRPQALSDISLTVQREFTGTTNGSGEITFNLSATGETFANSSDWLIVTDSDGAFDTISVSAGGNGQATVTLDGLATSQNVTLLAYVNKGAATVRTKTLTNGVDSGVSAASRTLPIDTYRINSITDDTSGEDVTFKYTFDNGQRDTHYVAASVTLKSGVTSPSGTITIDYDYFTHGTTGDFFSVNSYSGQVDYEDIPSYRQSNGEVVELRDVLDFRLREESPANIVNAFELPKNGDLITADVNYYNGQSYRVVLNPDGEFDAVAGQPSSIPTFPPKPDGSMELYRIILNPYTLNDSDVSLTYIDNKRYTMRDISDLERRMNKIEEVTSLTLLELETSTLEVLDASGNNRLKVGLTADNFKDHTLSDRSSIEYRASTDIFSRELRPPFVNRSTELIYDSANSSNTVLKADIVYPTYTEEAFITNSTASDPIAVNSFVLGVTVGKVKMSPSSDIWYDTETKPAKIVDGGFKLDVTNEALWKEWDFNWSGVEESELKVGYEETKTDKTSTSRYTTTSTVGFSIVEEETVKTSMGDTLLAETSIQYMRNRFIFFKASGLRPNTRYFAFFDNVSVANWVQTGSGKFNYWASLGSDSVYIDPGDKYKNNTKFPQSLGGPSSQIFSDANGVVEGIFFVPSNSTLRFLTGDREFLLIDVSDGNRVNATSYASTTFTSAGTLKTYQESIEHVRKYTIEGTIETKKKRKKKKTPAPSRDPVVTSDVCYGAPIASEPLVPPTSTGSSTPTTSTTSSSSDVVYYARGGGGK